ncbi:helix-turn-helix domain-containing protein [Vibrio sp. HN007]|uniref:AraC family transcriptional regulator n=1 Tax=Vibrio iocasae TaxID=3098914 RepID=UPI0035D51337
MHCKKLPEIESNSSEFNAMLLTDYVRRQFKSALTLPSKPESGLLILVTSGKGYHYIDEQVVFFKPGTLLMISQEQTHKFAKEIDWQGIVVTYDEQDVFSMEKYEFRIPVRKNVREINAVYDTDELLRSDFQYLLNGYLNQANHFSEAIYRNTLRNIIFKALSKSEQVDKREVRCKYQNIYFDFDAVLEKNFKDRKNVSDYADTMKLSSKLINTACQRVKGKSAKSIIDSRVILEAKRLLRNSSFTITEIADNLGFDQPTNLAKYFRRHTSVTPTEFRNMTKYFSGSM